MPTFLALKKGVIRYLKEQDDRVTSLPVGLTSTATAADKLSLRDTALARGSHRAGNYNGRHIEIAELVAGGPAIGEVAAVDDAGFDLADKLITSPAFSDEVQGGTDYLMYPKGLIPEHLKQALNDVLRFTEGRTRFPLSLHIVANDNNDMEGSGISGDYTPSNCTVTQETTIIHGGANSAKVTSSAADGGIYPAVLFPVNENVSYYAAVLNAVNRAITGESAKFLVYDENNSADIDPPVATNEEEAWMALILLFTAPSGCERVSFHMVSVGNGDISYWKDFQVWRNGDEIYPCPTYITHPGMIDRVEADPPGVGGPGAYDYRPDERDPVELRWHAVRGDVRATTPVSIWVENPGPRRPYIVVKRPFAELSALTDSTPCDEEYVVAKAAANILRKQGKPWKRLAEQAARRASQMNYGGQRIETGQNQVVV